MYITGLHSESKTIQFQCQVWPVDEKKYLRNLIYFVCLEFNSTFNNISVISWQSVLLVEEAGFHRENHQPSNLIKCDDSQKHLYCMV